MAFVLSWAIWRSRKTDILVSRARDGSKSVKSGSDNGDGDWNDPSIDVEDKKSLRDKFSDVIRKRRKSKEVEEIC